MAVRAQEGLEVLFHVQGAEDEEDKRLLTEGNVVIAAYDQEGGNILWRDNKLQTGCVYRNGTHTQETYFPSWISADSYTLYGSWLKPNTVRESTGKYVNNAYAWGYADNEGEDSTKGGDDGAKSYVEFKIENAVNADGTPANLLYIDFVRVQTAISHTAGELGEISTEITYIGE